jgi:hypothetical protein
VKFKLICLIPMAEFSCIEAELCNAENLELVCKLLKYLSSNIPLYNSSLCRPLRAVLQPLFDHQQKTMFGGKSLKEHKSELEKKKRAESMKTIKRAEDMKLLEKTQLRADRMKRLVQIDSQDGVNLPLILDGVANDGFNTTVLPVQIDSEFQAAAPSQTREDSDMKSLLNKFRSCYVCKRRFSELHHFYHSLCPFCAELNWQKRMQMCDLTGRICLVTGGRVKIGFQCCLKLLRCGATVISTSRFPVDAAKRFAAQSDFSSWRARIICIGLDLRDLSYLEFACDHIRRTFSKLDIIINNACQTIRRPRQYYAHMIGEEEAVSDAVRRSPRLQWHLQSGPMAQITAATTASATATHVATADTENTEDGSAAGMRCVSAVAAEAEGRAGPLTDLEQLLVYDLHTRDAYVKSLANTTAAPVKASTGSSARTIELDENGSAGTNTYTGNVFPCSTEDAMGTSSARPSAAEATSLSSAALSQVALTCEDLDVTVGEPGSGSLLPRGTNSSYPHIILCVAYV